MRKFFLSILIVAMPVIIFSQVGNFGPGVRSSAPLAPTDPQFPFRKLGAKHCDLRPLFAWYRLPPEKRKLTEQPLPAWQYFHGVEVKQIFGAVLLLDYGNGIILTNYPGINRLKDGDSIRFIAVEIGRYQYNDVRGAIRTAALWDHGVPYDPSTNAPAK